MKNLRVNMTNILKRFAADERGISALEYGLLAAGIAVVVYSAASGVGTELDSLFGTIESDLSTAATS